MSYLIDLSAIKSGGGLQLASNFLSVSKEELHNSVDVHLVVSAAIAQRLCDGEFSVVGVVPNGLIGRALFEYVQFPRLLRKYQVESIYTFFGAGMPVTNGVRAVVSVAYPIICYEDSPYWSYVPRIERLKKRLWNFVRISRLRRATTILCETEVMRKRLLSVLGADVEIFVSPPSPSEFIPDIAPSDRRPVAGNILEVLVLSGVAYHKNTWRLYEVAELLRRNGSRVRFVCSFSRRDFLRCLKAVEKHSVIDSGILDDCFDFIGSVGPEAIGGLYARCSVLISLSDLESYSNNYMEAWRTSTVLICSDRDFAREICRESALYCDPHSVPSVVSAIESIISAPSADVMRMLMVGRENLDRLPSQKQRAAGIWKNLRAAK